MSLILRIPRSKPKTLWGLIIFAFVTTIWGCGGGGGGDQGSSGLPPSPGGSGDGGSVTFSVPLAWDAPTTRVNGDTLANSDIKSYRLRYGSCQSLDKTDWTIEVITNPGISPVTHLPQGPFYIGTKYCFDVNAIDTNDLESEYYPDTPGTGETFCVQVGINGNPIECESISP